MNFEVMARTELVASAMDRAAERVGSYLPLLAEEIKELANLIRQAGMPDSANLDALVLTGNGPAAKAVKAMWLINNPDRPNVQPNLAYESLIEGQDLNTDDEQRRTVESYRYMLDPLVDLKRKGELNCNLPGFTATSTGFTVTILQGVIFETTVAIDLTGQWGRFHHVSAFSAIEEHQMSGLGMGATWFLNNVIIPLYELNDIDPVWRTEYNLSHGQVFSAIQEGLNEYPPEQHYYILNQLTDRFDVDSTEVTGICFRPSSLKEDTDKPILDEIHVWLKDRPQFLGRIQMDHGLIFDRLPQPYRKQVIDNLEAYVRGSIKQASEKYTRNQVVDD